MKYRLFLPLLMMIISSLSFAQSMLLTDSPDGLSSTGSVIKLSTRKLSFGIVVVGQHSRMKTVTMSNVSSNPLEISSITITGANGTEFTQTNTCGSSLAGGSQCVIHVTFTPGATGSGTASMLITDSDPSSPQAVTLSGFGTGFVATGDMKTGRYLQTATLLENGKVLIAGGLNAFGIAVASSELYDPATGSFTYSGTMTTTRFRHTATLLNNGKVLITGGEISGTGPPSVVATAEIYDPATGLFTATGSMTTGREFHTATVLANGKVLVAGGLFADINGNYFLGSAELYDPNTGVFSFTGSLQNAREEHTATLLSNGKVLIAGGNNGGGGFKSAELYDPTTGTFSLTGTPKAARSGHSAALPNTGKVLIASGYDPVGSSLISAELYDPTTAAFAYTGSMTVPREYQAASMLNDGTVLISGGLGTASAISEAELYNPVTAKFTFAGNMLDSTYWQTSTLLTTSNILLTGGNTIFPSESQLYLTGNASAASLKSITVTPSNPTLPRGVAQKLVATGTLSNGSQQVLQSVIWSSSNQAVAGISNDGTNHGVAVGIATGVSTITARVGSIVGSTNLTVN